MKEQNYKKKQEAPKLSVEIGTRLFGKKHDEINRISNIYLGKWITHWGGKRYILS